MQTLFVLWRRCVLAHDDRTGPSEHALLDGQSRRQWGQPRPLWAVKDVLGPEEYRLYKSGLSPERIRRSGLCRKSRPLYREQRARSRSLLHRFPSMVCLIMGRETEQQAHAPQVQLSDLTSGFGPFLPEDGSRSTRLTRSRPPDTNGRPPES